MIDTILGHMYQADTTQIWHLYPEIIGMDSGSSRTTASCLWTESPRQEPAQRLPCHPPLSWTRGGRRHSRWTWQCPPPRGRRRRTNSHVLKNRRSLTNDTFPSTNSLLTVKLSRYLLLLLLSLTNLSSCNINYQLPSLWTGKWFWWRRSLSGPGQRPEAAWTAGRAPASHCSRQWSHPLPLAPLTLFLSRQSGALLLI